MIVFEGQRFQLSRLASVRSCGNWNIQFRTQRSRCWQIFWIGNLQIWRTNAIITATDGYAFEGGCTKQGSIHAKNGIETAYSKDINYTYMYICTYSHGSGSTIQLVACLYGNCLSNLPVWCQTPLVMCYSICWTSISKIICYHVHDVVCQKSDSLCWDARII